MQQERAQSPGMGREKEFPAGKLDMPDTKSLASPIPEIIDGLPNICGSEESLALARRRHGPIYRDSTDLKLSDLTSTFSVALHMHQPLVVDSGAPASPLVSNLAAMAQSGRDEDRYNAGRFAECYGRMGDFIKELIAEGRSPRIMLDYSGELLYGLRAMGRGDVLDKLKEITCDAHLRAHVEWLGTMWGHAVVPSTPVRDLKLHIEAWQHDFAAVFGWEALGRVRGFSPPEMHLPNHPDQAYEYVKTLKECGYEWLLVQEHTVETVDGGPLARHRPNLLVARNSEGQEISIVAIVKTQGSDTKLVGHMQPMYEARSLAPIDAGGGAKMPPLVTQISDGENGGVMMNEFPQSYKQAVRSFDTRGTVNVNVTEYLELLAQAGFEPAGFPKCRPAGQGRLFARIDSWQSGAADRALAELKKSDPSFRMDGGSWTNHISWVEGYDNVLDPMNELSREFHKRFPESGHGMDEKQYRAALFYLLTSQTSCFRYWGQGAWTDQGVEICKRGMAALRGTSA